MTLLDGRGRLLGRFNVVDAAAAIVVVAAGVALYSGYRVLLMPGGPHIAAVEPSSQPAVNGARLKLHGRDFLPYHRVFVKRSGDTAQFVHEGETPVDVYTLPNHTQAQLLVEDPSTAEIRLPDRMGPGTYDLMFYNETREVSSRRAAFTLISAAPPPAPSPSAWVRADGTFGRLVDRDVALLTSGARLATDDAHESLDIVTVDRPQPEVARVGAGSGAVPAALEGRLQVPATVRVRCSVTQTGCTIGGAVVAAGSNLPARLGEHRYVFVVNDVSPDLPDVVRDADVGVRFVLRQAEAAAMKTGDLDAADAVAARHPRRAATLASIGARRDVTQRTLLNVTWPQRWIEEPAATVDAVLRVPLTQIDGVWLYKGQAIKSGGTIAFETPTYKTRAWVLNVAPRAPANRTE
jgi:hypothetical protein